ncbi:hypothetical protein JAAARDRAFT_198704 [Jaapia argillacea MUCL 33604]|uniref:Uncharacterized protein n=1 Tax=Jaapia argillacea MUCL 33604 TaxID=933084 RepID=A0A067PAV6_9AGAM|nr:hypothetical protein JAAARDRAFT_198704 [Jaapia argillacea MUCL 33604]
MANVTPCLIPKSSARANSQVSVATCFISSSQGKPLYTGGPTCHSELTLPPHSGSLTVATMAIDFVPQGAGSLASTSVPQGAGSLASTSVHHYRAEDHALGQEAPPNPDITKYIVPLS